MLTKLNSQRFADQSPRQVYVKLLDEGEYLCSVRTMYRILDENDNVRERRNQLTHPKYQEVPGARTAGQRPHYLYTIIDIYSRYTVDWMLAHRESADLAKQLIEQIIAGGSVGNVFDAPEAKLSLSWLRPRRASFRFARRTKLTIKSIFEHPRNASQNPGGSGAGP